MKATLKVLAAICLFLNSSTVFAACPDFEGEYTCYGSKGSWSLRIYQKSGAGASIIQLHESASIGALGTETEVSMPEENSVESLQSNRPYCTQQGIVTFQKDWKTGDDVQFNQFFFPDKSQRNVLIKRAHLKNDVVQMDRCHRDQPEKLLLPKISASSTSAASSAVTGQESIAMKSDFKLPVKKSRFDLISSIQDFKGLNKVENIRFLSSMSTLDIYQCLASARMKTAKKIDLSRIIGLDGDLVVSQLRSLRELTAIQFYYQKFSFLGLENLAKLLKANEGLKSVNLDGCFLGDSGVELVAAALIGNQNLSSLSLAKNSLTDEGMLAIYQLIRDQKLLKKLNLKGNHLTNDSVQLLSDLFRMNASLQSLNLENNMISISGRNFLKDMAKVHPTLTDLKLESAALPSIAQDGRNARILAKAWQFHLNQKMKVKKALKNGNSHF